MKAIINKGILTGTIHIPASKSMMQRACAAALLNRGKTFIYNPGTANDDKAAVDIMIQLGATLKQQTPMMLEIWSDGLQTPERIDCGESGLSTRLFAPIAALNNEPILIDGSGSLLKRPMDGFATIFQQLGVQLHDFNGYVPFTIEGPMQVRDIQIDGSLSSQFLSGLLFAFAYAAEQEVHIEVSNLKSKPYIDLSLDILQHFGYTITHENYERFHIQPLPSQQQEISIHIEGDWSSAACWLVAGAIAGSISIAGLNMHSRQADKTLLDVLKMTGAGIEIQESLVTITQPKQLNAFEFDATDCPDLFPVLAILAACCEGESYISGLHRLWHKESNRAESIAEMLQRFEVPFSIEDDMLCIEGVRTLQGGEINAYNDHRIVMAATIAAQRCKGDVIINGAEAVKKSYPDFFQHAVDAGISITLENE